MATQLQLRRGTNTALDTVVFAEGEIVYDKTNKVLRVGDGATAGGVPQILDGLTALNEDADPTLSADLNVNNSDIVNEAGKVTVEGVPVNDFLFRIPIDIAEEKDYTLTDFPLTGVIDKIRAKTAEGTCTVTAKIASTVMGGSANSAATTANEQNHTTDNVITQFDDFTLTISSNAAAKGLIVTLIGKATV